MSIGIFSIGSIISKGLAAFLHSSGQYRKIIMADIFPHYNYLKRLLSFKDFVMEKNGVKDCRIEVEKIQNFDELRKMMSKCDKFIYFSHNYYKNVPSKTFLLLKIAKIAK